MKLAKRYFLQSILIIFTLFPLAALSQEIKIDDISNSNTYKIQFDNGKAETTFKGANYSAEKSDGKFKLYKDGSLVASGKLKTGKLKLNDGSENNFLYIKITDEKIKITIKDEKKPWQLKYKDGKIKITGSHGDEYGKIKYYPDNKKTKLKNTQDKVIAESKDFNSLSAAIAGVIISDSSGSEDIKIFTMLTLLTLNK